MAISADLGKTLEKFVAQLDASIARGVADADSGRVKSITEVFDRLESKLKNKAKAAGQ
jgi:antitoxin ParD1/3/4